jgi:hypothetical protein
MMKSTNKKPPASTPVHAKITNGVVNLKQPIAPPVYRPQPVPKVLQAKRPPGQNLQPGSAPRQPVAPPVYRPEAKKIVQPKSILSLRKSPTPPPAYRPEQTRALQRKTISGAMAHTPPKTGLGDRQQPWIGSQKNSVVQRAKRTQLADTRTLPGASVPDLKMETYKLHVAGRTVRFFQQILSAALAVMRKGGNVSHRLFTDHAKVQVQTGQRHKGQVVTVVGENNWDAAHLMNTSLDSREYAKQTGQNEDDEDVQRRLLASGATMNLFQKSNVSADKVIDTQQTVTKNAMLSRLSTLGSSFDAQFVRGFLKDYLTNLEDNLGFRADTTGLISGTDIKDDSYTAAHEVISAQLKDIEGIMSSINDELGGYLTEAL